MKLYIPNDSGLQAFFGQLKNPALAGFIFRMSLPYHPRSNSFVSALIN